MASEDTKRELSKNLQIIWTRWTGIEETNDNGTDSIKVDSIKVDSIIKSMVLKSIVNATEKINYDAVK